MSAGMPIISAMTMAGIGAAKARSSSTWPSPANPSISSLARRSMRGRSCSTLRETNARLTSARSRV